MKFKTLFTLSIGFLSLACSNPTNGQKSQNDSSPVKSIDIYVMPYYSAQNGKAEIVNVYNQINTLLLSNNQQDFAQAIKIVESDPQLVTPMTMFTLSARAYDFGLRDEATKWFYRGQYRLITALTVLDLQKTTVAEYTAFSSLVGRFVNSYAYCDLAKQRKIASEQIQWVKANPYQALFLSQIPAKIQDRKQGLKQAEAILDKRLQEQDQFFANKEKRTQWENERKQNHVPEKFCWK